MGSAEFYQKHIKRNFIAIILDGGFCAFGMGMAPLATVLLFFVSDFVTQKWILGLLPCLFSLLVLTPQVLLTKKVESLRAYKPFTVFMTLLNRFAWLFLALDVYFFADTRPTLFIVIFYILYSIIGLSIGFSGLPALCLISRVIPDNARGRLFGIKSTVGGIFELLGSLTMGIILKSQGYPVNYAILFLVVFISMSISVVFIAMVREKESEGIPLSREDGGIIRKMKGILKQDKSYTFFILSLILVTAFGTMPFSFQTVYAKDKLGITTQEVFVATLVLLASQTIGYLVWGYVGDKFGHRLTLLLSTILFIPTLVFTYLMTSQWIFLLSICLLGLSRSAFNINTDNLTIRLCADKTILPTYIALRCLVTGPFIAFGSLLGGFIIDHLGYGPMFLSSFIFILAGLFMIASKVKESPKNEKIE